MSKVLCVILHNYVILHNNVYYIQGVCLLCKDKALVVNFERIYI